MATLLKATTLREGGEAGRCVRLLSRYVGAGRRSLVKECGEPGAMVRLSKDDQIGRAATNGVCVQTGITDAAIKSYEPRYDGQGSM
jgi:hypothetical protein